MIMMVQFCPTIYILLTLGYAQVGLDLRLDTVINDTSTNTVQYDYA